MRDKPIPSRIIDKLLPAMVGRGLPPITMDELVAISDARAFSSGEISSIDYLVPEDVALRLKHRAERGAYIDIELLEAKDYGPSSLVASSDRLADEQFAVLVADTHAMPDFALGDVLHCVRGTGANGKRAVVAIERPNRIAEILVGKAIEEKEPGSVRVVVGDSKPTVGLLIGVIVGIYRRIV